MSCPDPEEPVSLTLPGPKSPRRAQEGKTWGEGAKSNERAGFSLQNLVFAKSKNKKIKLFLYHLHFFDKESHSICGPGFPSPPPAKIVPKSQKAYAGQDYCRRFQKRLSGPVLVAGPVAPAAGLLSSVYTCAQSPHPPLLLISNPFGFCSLFFSLPSSCK